MTDGVPHRVVFDPNVFVSATISPHGATARLLDHIDAGVLIPIMSAALLAELDDVLTRPKFRRYFDISTARALTEDLTRQGEWHLDTKNPPQVCSDRDDDYLFALARAANADAIVSGDPDLNAARAAGIRVLTPRMLLDLIDSTDW